MSRARGLLQEVNEVNITGLASQADQCKWSIYQLQKAVNESELESSLRQSLVVSLEHCMTRLQRIEVTLARAERLWKKVSTT